MKKYCFVLFQSMTLDSGFFLTNQMTSDNNVCSSGSTVSLSSPAFSDFIIITVHCKHPCGLFISSVMHIFKYENDYVAMTCSCTFLKVVTFIQIIQQLSFNNFPALIVAITSPPFQSLCAHWPLCLLGFCLSSVHRSP